MKLYQAISWNRTTIIQTSSYKQFWLLADRNRLQAKIHSTSVNQTDFPSKVGSISFFSMK
jgi:hypothetical protein